MGLVQREIEAAGFSTIILSNIPDLTASVSVPRVVAVEYPFGQTIGKPGDAEGQLAVLRGVMQALTDIDRTGEIRHLPFTWPELPKEAGGHPSEPPPIVRHIQRNPWQLPRLIKRDIPKEYR